MPSASHWTLLALCLVSLVLQKTGNPICNDFSDLSMAFDPYTFLVILDAQFREWCIADEQTPDEELKKALDWACGKGGADCSKIQVNQPCYHPNTIKNHASYAFNNYYQKFKNKGATCYFNSAAIITDLDPSNIIILYHFFSFRLNFYFVT
ncbi:glucan endo-1,3-beta-glucosidase 12-like [Durio zibethinus]|uniref:Glucan endo-1,3-beta-glucosidase 12-like n=1 Tax=Durio zibethinus TaxID=66656 RepID=A0A6P5X6D3_DURZI|nr:glucan endo-1,3-beta-glucosidase 12-like [Durio zibethinus]